MAQCQTSTLTAQQHTQFKAFFAQMSEPRIRAYGVSFRTRNERELLGAYLWGQATSAAFQPFISLAEVTLRNAIHVSLSLQTSNHQSDSYPWYDENTPGGLQLQNPSKTAASVKKLLFTLTGMRKSPQPTPDKVVSELSFGVWSDVLAAQLPRLHQARTFTDVFANYPNSKPGHWSHGPNRVMVVDRVKKLQRLRNRVSHFEPVWTSSTFQSAQGGSHWSHAVQALRVCKGDLHELLQWISVPSWLIYRDSFAAQWLDRLITTDAVKSFMHDPMNAGRLDALILPPAAVSPAAAVVLPAAA
jgi:hypothetical protein